MKKLYTWHKNHITLAIFTALMLGILTGLFLADRFVPVLTVTELIGGIYMNALNMMIFPLEEPMCPVIMIDFNQRYIYYDHRAHRLFYRLF